MNRIVVVGSYNQDHVWSVDTLPRSGETRTAQKFATGPGGKGFNQAVACARQGVITHFIAAVGNDAAGESAKALARSEGLIARWQATSVATGSAGIFVDAQGHNSIAVALGANQQLSPAFIDSHTDDFKKAQILLMQLETEAATVESAIALAKTYSLRCVINPAPMSNTISINALRHADLITPNESEFVALITKVDRDARLNASTLVNLDDATLADLCARLGIASVIVTLGEHGCFVFHAEHATLAGDDPKVSRVAAETVNAIDTTGAGDAFNGGLVAAMSLFEGKSFLEQVRYASRVAALSTERAGAASAMPYRHELERRFNNARSRLDRID